YYKISHNVALLLMMSYPFILNAKLRITNASKKAGLNERLLGLESAHFYMFDNLYFTTSWRGEIF
ncbi:MAG: hypothetical protein Q8S23_02085, partial [Bacteroidales bacterium]|nr:hypothetical protein [Bacteroidales bacterium]